MGRIIVNQYSSDKIEVIPSSSQIHINKYIFKFLKNLIYSKQGNTNNMEWSINYYRFFNSISSVGI